MELKIIAYQIAESFNIREIKKSFVGRLVSGGQFDLFYELEDKKYALFLDYGVAVFAGFDSIDISKFISYLQEYSTNLLEEPLTEDFLISESGDKMEIAFNSASLRQLTEKGILVTMFNVGQSVGLDYYSHIAQNLLDSTTEQNDILERSGKFKFSKKELVKFIGKSMNIKKKIIDNIYVLDEPDFIWDDEYLTKFNNGLREIFDIRARFREIDYQLQIAIDNLHILTELIQHRTSNRLEWIIILLILVEVIDMFINKLFY